MTTQISFTTDQALKKMALQKARKQGITLRAFLTYAMQGFVDGKIELSAHTFDKEPEIEELVFTDKALNGKAQKLAHLLR